PRPPDGHGRRVDPDRFRVAQPGGCLFEGWPLLRGRRTVSRPGPVCRPGYAEPHRRCLGSCGLRSEVEVLSTAQLDALPDTPDENGARRLYLMMELARNRNDLDRQKSIVTQMESRFSQSQW